MDKADLEIQRVAPDADEDGETSIARPTSWVDELIAMTRPGLEMNLPDRASLGRIPPYGFDDFS